MFKRTVLFSLLVVVGVDLHAACNLNFRKTDLGDGKRWRLEWFHAAGHDRPYLLIEYRDVNGGQTTLVHQVLASHLNEGRFDVSMTTTSPVTKRYRLETQEAEPCSAELTVTFAPDPDFVRMTRKSIIPLVGSTPGLNGARFNTSLRLRGATGMKGRLVLHPLGRPGSDNDPQTRYEFRETDNGVIEYEDIVAQLGVTGLGSLDIIPDPNTGGRYIVPMADVRLYNEANGGTYGTIESQTQAFDFYGGRPETIGSMTVIVPGPELRLNIGFRTVEGTGVIIYARRGDQTIAIVHPTVEGDYLIFGSAESILGVDLMPGDEIRMLDDGGSIQMYSLTDNVTNDPALFVPPTRVLTDVTHFELP